MNDDNEHGNGSSSSSVKPSSSSSSSSGSSIYYSEVCTACDTGYKLSNAGVCVKIDNQEDCDEGYFLNVDTGKCRPCSVGCD
jgi:hypothetical protein